MAMIWIMMHPRATHDMLGFIPGFLDENDPRSAKEQIHANYISGWHTFQGFKMADNGNLLYPGDPPTRLLAMTHLRNETILFYEHDWLAIMQRDGSFEVARID
ncbi:MAG TPA: hypothetical protein VIJ87_16530 [Pyrinomonadaceae bacterium]|jgi:hypothetical protein